MIGHLCKTGFHCWSRFKRLQTAGSSQRLPSTQVSLPQLSSQQHDFYNSTWRGYCVSLHNSWRTSSNRRHQTPNSISLHKTLHSATTLAYKKNHWATCQRFLSIIHLKCDIPALCPLQLPTIKIRLANVTTCLHVELGRASPTLFANQTLIQWWDQICGQDVQSLGLKTLPRHGLMDAHLTVSILSSQYLSSCDHWKKSVKVDISVLLDLHQKITVRVSLKTIPLWFHDQPFQIHISTMGNFLSFWAVPFEGTTVSLGDFPFEELFPTLCVCGLGAREDDCVFFPRLLSSWRKLQASPFVHYPFAFHWKHSPSFLSTRACFPLRVFINTPVSILSFLAWKFRVLIFWFKGLCTMVLNFL